MFFNVGGLCAVLVVVLVWYGWCSLCVMKHLWSNVLSFFSQLVIKFAYCLFLQSE